MTYAIGGLFEVARAFQKQLTMASSVRIVERIEEALREIAVRNGLIFVGVGLMVCLVALFVERKRSRG